MAASSSTRLATVFAAKLLQKASFFGHRMSAALSIQSFMNALSMEVSDDFEIISLN